MQRLDTIIETKQQERPQGQGKNISNTDNNIIERGGGTNKNTEEGQYSIYSTDSNPYTDSPSTQDQPQPSSSSNSVNGDSIIIDKFIINFKPILSYLSFALLATTKKYLPKEKQRLTLLSTDELNYLDNYYTHNILLPIKNFTADNIVKMRNELIDLKLNRSDKSIKDIRGYIIDNFETSKNKAVFLARQETSIMTAEIVYSYVSMSVYLGE